MMARPQCEDDTVLSASMSQMTPQWPPHHNSCLSLTRYHPVATTLPHGCCSRDYHSDKPEVKGSVPGVGPPTMQAGSPETTALSLRRQLFTSYHFRVAKWIKQRTRFTECKKIIVVSLVAAEERRRINDCKTFIDNTLCLQCHYDWMNTNENH